MIVLDTNILSELVRTTPAPEVKDWLLKDAADEALVTTAITISEIAYGLARLPDGKRKQGLEERFHALTGSTSNLAVLIFDEDAAHLAGKMRAAREAQGLHAQSADMMIAAITFLAGASLATRNVKDFTETGIELMNPWERVS